MEDKLLSGNKKDETASGAAFRIRYVGSRIIQMLPTLFLILLSAFLLLQLAPGDIAQVLAGENGGGDAQYLDMLRRSFGLDQPLHIQFLYYAGNVLSGHLGISFRHNMPVLELIGTRLLPTLLLTGSGLAIAVLLGISAGVVAAAFRGRLPDRIIGTITLLIYATPGFLVGIGLMVLFAVTFPLFPVGGFTDPVGVQGEWDYVLSITHHLILPATTLGLLYAALYARFTRGAMLEIYDQDHVRTARSKGLKAGRIALRHVLRNALLPIVTLIGLQTGSLLSGAILVETVFSWPGLGRLAFEALQQRDYNLLAGLILCTGTVAVIINLVVDLLYSALDPRVLIR